MFDTLIERMQLRFNKKSLETLKLSAVFELFESLITITEENVLTICFTFLVFKRPIFG